MALPQEFTAKRTARGIDDIDELAEDIHWFPEGLIK
jgi:hypothetical protein